MSRPRLTSEQKRELVLEYLAVPYGERGKWLATKDVTRRSFYQWRQQLIAGSIETGTVPRGGVRASEAENKEITRLNQEVIRLKAKLAKAERDAETQTRTIDVLGKAIEFLQGGTASRNSDERGGHP